MLRSLGLSDVKDHRRDTQVALLFKIINGDVAVAVDNLHLEQANWMTTSNHLHEYKHKGASTPELQNLFHNHSISLVELATCFYSRVHHCLQPSRTLPPIRISINTPQRRSADYCFRFYYGISLISVVTSCEQRLAAYYYASWWGVTFCIALMCRFGIFKFNFGMKFNYSVFQ